MARPPKVDESRLSLFARWLSDNARRRGYSVQRMADHAEMHVSHLHKILKSYLPQYAQYQRPGYEKTVLIGELFGDVPGALRSAGYTKPDRDPEPLPANTKGNDPEDDLDISYAPSWHKLSNCDKQVIMRAIDGLNALADANDTKARAGGTRDGD